jgi:hypothetical protein
MPDKPYEHIVQCLALLSTYSTILPYSIPVGTCLLPQACGEQATVWDTTPC